MRENINGEILEVVFKLVGGTLLTLAFLGGILLGFLVKVISGLF